MDSVTRLPGDSPARARRWDLPARAAPTLEVGDLKRIEIEGLGAIEMRIVPKPESPAFIAKGHN